jgi:hypothetical protein
MPKLPYEVTVEYLDGSVGTLALWAEDMRQALEHAAYWLVLNIAAVKVEISLRMETH